MTSRKKAGFGKARTVCGAAAIAAACSALLGAPPASASAGAPTMHLSLPASNGYTLQVKTEGDLAQISFRRRARASAEVGTTYYVDEAVSPGAIDADLGPLGSVHLRFSPSGRTRTLHLERGEMPPGCRAPQRLRRRLGSFEGSISIRGEGGFAAVDAARASGSVGPSARRRCRGDAPAPRRAGAPAVPRVEQIWIKSDILLSVRDPAFGDEPSMTWFLVGTTENGEVHYSVDRFERLPSGLSVRRSAWVTGPAAGFLHSGDLTEATLRPPAPYSGEATFSKAGRRLSGDLSVELPGVGPQALTGSRFEARIYADR